MIGGSRFDTTLLNGRSATCILGCNVRVVSSTLLHHFEYMGAGSLHAAYFCRCGYHVNAHAVWDPRFHFIVRLYAKRHALVCDGFVATGPAEFDRFLCCSDVFPEALL